MLRNILGLRLKDKINISDIFNKTKTTNIVGRIKKLKLKYAGHVVRESKYKWNKITTLWIRYEGKRKRGRSVMRWKNEVVRVAGPSWAAKAHNRRMWEKLSIAYTQ